MKNRTDCGDGLSVGKDSNGNIGLRFDSPAGASARYIDQAAAAKLCEWLMFNLPIKAWDNVPLRTNGTVGSELLRLASVPGVTITDTTQH